MTAFTYFGAMLMVIVPFYLIEEVGSMRSLTQDEGNNMNNDATANAIILLARQGEQHHQVRGHNHNVKQYVSANDDDDGEDDDDDDDYAFGWEKTKEIRKQKRIQKHKAIRRKHNKKRTKEGGKRRNWAKNHKRINQKKPVDVVLLVDASNTMSLWFMERIKRVQNITKGLAMEFLDNDGRNRIAIAQFDHSHAKILLQMGKWQESSIKSAVNQLKSQGEYKEDESFGGRPEQFTGYTVALITAKNIFNNSPRKDSNRIAILITDGMDVDRFNEDKIIREELNVRIMVVFVGSDAKRAKKDFFNDPNGLAWAGVNKIVIDPEKDIIFDDTGTCQTESDCVDGSKCFFPNNSMYGLHRGYCGCLPPGTTFDVKKYSLKDCCLTVPLPYYATPEHYYDECF